MSNLDKLFGIEKLDKETANMNSNFAYITYLESMGLEEVNSKGKIVQFNRPCFKGQVDLISASEFNKFKSDFPNQVKGNIITYGNLENMSSLCYDKLKDEYKKLGESDEYCDHKLNILEDFYRDGKLRADHQTKESIEDLANKVFGFQDAIRELQVNNLSNSNSRRM